MSTSDLSQKEIYEIILDVIEPKLKLLGFDRKTIDPSTDLMDVLDSFGLLETILETESRANITVDMEKMDLVKGLSIGHFANEFIRIGKIDS